MNFQELIKHRHSIRSYKSDAVPDELLQQVLEAARLAPTACNLQPFHIIVVSSEEQHAALSTAYPRDWFNEAPLHIVLCVEREKAWKRKQDQWNGAEVDAAIAMDHMILAATELGLGTCWIAAFDPDIVHEVLNLPEEIDPLLITPLGYPGPDATRSTSRKPLSVLRHDNSWTNS